MKSWQMRFGRLGALALIALVALAAIWALESGAAEAQSGETGFVETLSAGRSYSCALTTAGAIECWGDDEYGRASPPSGRFTQVSAGRTHSCALTTAGAIECWGSDYFGQASPPSGRFTQVSAGATHSCALTTAGAIECWGSARHVETRPQIGRFTQVSAGNERSCALTTAGALECWGQNWAGYPIPQIGSFTQVSAGWWRHSCALTTAGGVECWGSARYVETRPQIGRFTQVSTGASHSCALTTAGAVQCWGGDRNGQSSPPAGHFTQVSAGEEHSCGLTASGGVECWGQDNNGETSPPAGLQVMQGGASEPQPGGEQYQLSTQISPSGGGSVSGGGSYDSGAQATLRARAADGYEFSHWLIRETIGGDQKSRRATGNPLSLTVAGAVSATAVFEQQSEPTCSEETLHIPRSGRLIHEGATLASCPYRDWNIPSRQYRIALDSPAHLSIAFSRPSQALDYVEIARVSDGQAAESITSDEYQLHLPLSGTDWGTHAAYLEEGEYLVTVTIGEVGGTDETPFRVQLQTLPELAGLTVPPMVFVENVQSQALRDDITDERRRHATFTAAILIDEYFEQQLGLDIDVRSYIAPRWTNEDEYNEVHDALVDLLVQREVGVNPQWFSEWWQRIRKGHDVPDAEDGADEAAGYWALSARLLVSKIDRPATLAHEYYHTAQSKLEDFGGRTCLSDAKFLSPVPLWTYEGSADLIVASFLDWAGYRDYQSWRNALATSVAEYSRSSTYPQWQSLTLKNSGNDAVIVAPYRLGALAFELLTHHSGGLNSINEYFRARADHCWMDAFEMTFGISVDDFYVKFEDWRRRGFPSDAMPSLSERESVTVRIAAQRLSNGRIEFALQPEGAELILPRSRMFPSNARVDRWLNSSPIEYDGRTLGRISAQLLSNGQVEFSFLPADGGDRILPRLRRFPAGSGTTGWLKSSAFEVP